MKLKYFLVLALATAAFLASLHAQDETGPIAEADAEQAALEAEWTAFLDSLNWKTEGDGDLNNWATIEIPAGYRYLNGEDASKLMQAYGNLPSEYEGLIATDDLSWLVLFYFEDSGYVKDDDKDQLNAGKLLKTLQEQQVASNEYRRDQGLEEMYLDGWAVEPKYNEMTNNLEWGLLLRSGNSGQFVNYKTKLLGRNGIMHVTLICDLEQLNTVLPTYQDLLLGHHYNPGKSYAEYKPGDKVAEYGLTALIAGGAIYGAAKLGLLSTILAFGKKFLKLIIAGIVAIGVAIKKFFAHASGRDYKRDDAEDAPPAS